MEFKAEERLRPVDEGVVIYPAFSEDVAKYFSDHAITWWGGTGAPPENPVSSQVACVNHLDPARQDERVALAVARSVLEAVEAMRAVEDDGYVAYEWVGQRKYLTRERSHSRGAHATSLDALMTAETRDGTVLILIEWKYTECYPPGESLAMSPSGTDRVEIYRELLERPDCPIQVPSGDLRALFYDPIYQLMRQTLLGWQMVEARELGASDWRHVWVAPEGNRRLLGTNTAPGLAGDTLAEAWQGVLLDPSRFVVMTPTELLGAFDPSGEWAGWRLWLNKRYGT